MAFLKILLILGCAIIAYQDFRERAVIWILFPITAVLLFFLHLSNTQWEQLLLFSVTNVLLVSGVLLILFLYTKHILHRKFINTSFGLGDVLFFYAMALGFPTITFALLFVGATFFSLIVFVLLKSKLKTDTVPLAGLMGIFLIGVFLFSFLPNAPSLYSI